MIVLWNLTTFERVHVLDGSKDCMSVAFSPDGKLVAGGHEQRGARLWDSESGSEVTTLFDPVREDDGHIGSIQFSSDSQRVIYGNGRRARIWDVAQEKVLLRMLNRQHRIEVVSVHPTLSSLATAGDNGVIAIWDTKSGELERRIEFDPQTDPFEVSTNILQVGFTPDGRLLACVDLNDNVRLFETKAYNLAGVLRAPLCRSFGFSADSKLIALEGTTVRIHDVQSRKLLGELPEGRLPQFSPDGRLLVTTGTNFDVNVWDLAVVLPNLR
jgi:WD40 repeat protein